MKRETFWLCLIFEVAIILRLFWLGSTAFWYDESFSYLVARLPIDRLIGATLGDVHPPLYYILASPFARLPWQPAGLRLFSVLCSLAGLWVLWLITGRLKLSTLTRYIALGVMAIWPTQLYYAQEGRMYALMQLLILALWLAVLDRRWVLCGVLALAAMYTHNYAAFYVGILALAALGPEMLRGRDFYSHKFTWPKPHEGSPEFVLIAFGAAYLLFAPWALSVFIVQIPAIQNYWLDLMTPGTALLNTANLLVTMQGSGITDPPGVILMAVAVPVLAWHALNNKKFTLFMLAFIPMLTLAAISLIWKPVYLNRGFFPSLPAVYILLADWFVRASRPRRWFALGLVVPALLSSYLVWMSSQVNGVRTMSVNYAKGASVLRNLPVVHLDDSSWVIWSAARPDLPQYLLLNTCPEEAGSLTERTRRALGMTITDPAAIPPAHYTVAVANIFSPQCVVDRNAAYTAGDQPVYEADLLFGYLGVYEHAAH